VRVIIALILFSVTFAKAEDSTQVSVDFVKRDSTANNENVFFDCGLSHRYKNTLGTSGVPIMNFEPLIANPYEARIGFIGQPSEERLRMDIGASFDLFDLGGNSTFGADLMTYTRLRSVGRFKFPVETTDYYFGVNSAFTFHDSPIFGNLFYGTEQLRLRLAHISSHLIDGYTIDNEFISDPFIYSREFLEVIYRVNIYSRDANREVYPYLGINYVFSKIPNDIQTIELISGIEFTEKLSESTDFEMGYNFSLRGFNDNYYGVSNAQAGLRYNFSKNRAIFIGIYAYDGLSMHGMFFNQKDSYIGIGTQVYYF
jgi:hypothetical protein